jgi:hypothetical protein
MPPAPAIDNNFSTLLQFLHQELLSSDNHDSTKESIIAYFQEAGCDSSQLDIIHTSFQKATLDTKAFSGLGVDNKQQTINPKEFSQRLVKELTKKYSDTKSIQHRINQLEELCVSNTSSSSSTSGSKVSLEEAIKQFSDVRLSTYNLEAAMVSISEQTLGRHVKDSSGRGKTSVSNRHMSVYDEQILILRKKLSVSVLHSHARI